MTERSEVRWGRTAIPFVVRRSERRKTVALTMDDGLLVVTSPPGVSLARLDAVVRGKASWVVERLRRAAELEPRPSAREFVTGETVLYRGRQLRLKVVETTEASPSRMWAGWYEVLVPRGLREEDRAQEVRRRLASSLKGHAERALPSLLKAASRRVRVETPALKVCEQQRRWGSCDARGVVRINWRIIQAPRALIDYVLVHELVHLEHRAHGPAFWKAVARCLPDYEDRRRRLRALGPSLVW